MATIQQVALTRAQRIPTQPTHISKAARQVVPAFLQKLYEMVNDPNNAELIRWSEAGDSFFVLDHERFAHEVLGRWFKHRNFNSFVRQLNMYGFHKIPHLQQGVLKSDTDTEFWNFAHPNFHRGQPDLLCLIQRKKQAAQPGGDNAIELRDPNTSVSVVGGPPVPSGMAASAPTPFTNAQVLDIQSIISGINAIKRHQTTISSELNELKRSNQLLWQDALTARAKHQKQQDTINRIVKFLAGVFGNHAAGGIPTSVSVSGNSSPVGQHGKQDGTDIPTGKRRARLMIEDAKRDGPTKSIVEELNDMDMDLDSSGAFVETPASAPSPSPSVDGSAYFNLDSKTQTPVAEAPLNPLPPSAQTAATQEQGKEISRAVTPTMPAPIDFDARIAGMLHQMSPAQIQQLVASLAAQTFVDANSNPAGTINPNSTGTIAPYQPPTFDFLSHQPQPAPTYPDMPGNSQDGLASFNPYQDQPGDHPVAITGDPALDQRIDSQWKVAEDIDKDVSAITTSIDSLIQGFGLDPSDFDNADPPNPTPSTIPDPHPQPILDGPADPINPDFDFETFFNTLSTTSTAGPELGGLDASSFQGSDDMAGYASGLPAGGPGASSAFLDEVHTPAGSSDLTASPIQPLRQVSPELNIASGSGTRARSGSVVDPGGSLASPTAAAKGRKRKSEVVVDQDANALPIELTAKGTTGTKSKRRRDK